MRVRFWKTGGATATKDSTFKWREVGGHVTASRGNESEAAHRHGGEGRHPRLFFTRVLVDRLNTLLQNFNPPDEQTQGPQFGNVEAALLRVQRAQKANKQRQHHLAAPLQNPAR